MNLPVRQYFQLLSDYLRPQWQRVAVLTVLLFTSIGLQLWAPQILRQFVDAAQGQVDDSTLVSLRNAGILFLIITITYQTFRLATAYVTENVKWHATNLLRNDLSAHCLELDMSFHNENTPGSMIERIDGDVEQLSNFFSQFVQRLMGNSFLMIGVLVFLYIEDYRIGLAFTLFAVTMFFTLAQTVSFGIPRWSKQREALSSMFGFLEETLGGTEDIRANGGVDYAMGQLQRKLYDVFTTTRSAFYAGNLTWGTSNIFTGISNALALGLSGYLYGQGSISLGTVYLVFYYANSLQRPLEQMAKQLQDLQAATAAIGRIQELLDQKPTVTEIAQPRPLPKNTALSVEFDNVSFGYVPDELVLKGVSFQLEAGNTLGLLGRTGSGKTTITRLLFRLHDPNTGQVLLADEDVRLLRLGDVRAGVGMVTQEVQLFQATVRDNLTFFDATIADEAIYDALEILGLMDWYRSLENGLDSYLASGGRGLSAGEAQLLAFTRVFLKDPGLVILDEASSRLDPVTEMLIERAIDTLLQSRTAIIVAHRLPTVQRADDILILHDGEILEHDNRLALLANPDSHFRQLLATGLEEVLV